MTARLESNGIPKNPKTELKSGYCVEIRDQSDYTALYTSIFSGVNETNSDREISQIIEEYASRDRKIGVQRDSQKSKNRTKIGILRQNSRPIRLYRPLYLPSAWAQGYYLKSSYLSDNRRVRVAVPQDWSQTGFPKIQKPN